MAPEMRRESSTADVSKADVYSLAKTLWIYLTGNKKDLMDNIQLNLLFI